MVTDGSFRAEGPHDAETCLAEARAFMAARQPERARAFLEAALANGGEQKDLLALLAWLCSETGDRGGAADAFVRLSALVPLEPDQQAFIGFDHLAEGRVGEAEPRLRAAVAARPDDAVFRAALVDALVRLDRPRDALVEATPALRRGTASAGLWQSAIDTATALDRKGLALVLARRGVRLLPGELAPVYALARLLLDRREAHEAIRVLADVADADQPELWFLRSVALAQVDRHVEAVAVAEKALVMAPRNRGYALHAAALLGQLGRHGDAATHVDAAGGYAPGESDQPWLRGLFATYTEAGRYDQAIEVGARLVQLVPNDLDFLSVYQTVIGKQLYARLLSRGGPGTVAPVPPSRERATHVGRIRPQSSLRSVAALFRREMKTRFGRSRLGYAWVLFEPLAHIGIMIFLIGMLNHGGLPPIGQSFAVFYFTGIIPFHMFTHTTGHLIGSVPENRPLLQIPRVRILDIFAARALLEAVTELIVAAILLSAFLVAGLDAMPIDPVGALGGLLLLWIGALGVGMMSAAIVSVFPAWERIWGAMASVIYFTSGTFYIPRNMPIWIRDILVWNPVLQGIELVRFHYFHEPAPEWLSVRYLAGFAIGVVAIGLVMERTMRRRMLDVE